MANKIIEKLVKKISDEKTVKFSELDAFDPKEKWISTGSPSLDYNLRTLGYTTGIVEVRGESQSGKTTLSLHLMASSLKQYKDKVLVTIISSERRDNKSYADQIGIDTNDVLVHKVRTIGSVSNTIFQNIKLVEESYEGSIKDILFVFIWDSLGQTVSKQELEKARENSEKGEENKAALGSAARDTSSVFKNIIGLQDDYNILLYVVNRPYDRVDGRPGKKSYGGKAITLFPYMRLDLSRKQGIKIGDDECGQITKVKTIKTDFDKPKQEFEIEIGYGLGIVLSEQDVKIGIEAGVLEKFGRSGASFMKGKLKWQNRRELYALYQEKNPMLKVLLKKLTDYTHKKILKERGY